MHNRHYNTRYERIQAQRAPLIPRPRVRSHKHRCACGEAWDCEMLLCSPAHPRVKTCIQCIKREKELNSGEQQILSFEPVVTYTYAQYSDFMNFTDIAIELSKNPAKSLNKIVTADDVVYAANVLTEEQVKASMQLIAQSNISNLKISIPVNW
jgi:hypothetical protein